MYSKKKPNTLVLQSLQFKQSNCQFPSNLHLNAQYNSHAKLSISSAECVWEGERKARAGLLGIHWSGGSVLCSWAQWPIFLISLKQTGTFTFQQRNPETFSPQKHRGDGEIWKNRNRIKMLRRSRALIWHFKTQTGPSSGRKVLSYSVLKTKPSPRTLLIASYFC